MLAFARETKLSETTFIQTRDRGRAPTTATASGRSSASCPSRAIPSLGTAVALAHARAEREAHYVQQTVAGLQPVDVELGVSGVARASMLQEPAVFGAEVDPEWVLGALGLDAADAHPELPPQVVSTGVAQLMVPVRDAEVLAPGAPRRRAAGRSAARARASSASTSPPTIPPTTRPTRAATSRPTG